MYYIDFVLDDLRVAIYVAMTTSMKALNGININSSPLSYVSYNFLTTYSHTFYHDVNDRDVMINDVTIKSVTEL
jgi:hypothetical protein